MLILLKPHENPQAGAKPSYDWAKPKEDLTLSMPSMNRPAYHNGKEARAARAQPSLAMSIFMEGVLLYEAKSVTRQQCSPVAL